MLLVSYLYTNIYWRKAVDRWYFSTGVMIGTIGFSIKKATAEREKKGLTYSYSD